MLQVMKQVMMPGHGHDLPGGRRCRSSRPLVSSALKTLKKPSPVSASRSFCVIVFLASSSTVALDLMANRWNVRLHRARTRARRGQHGRPSAHRRIHPECVWAAHLLARLFTMTSFTR